MSEGIGHTRRPANAEDSVRLAALVIDYMLLTGVIAGTLAGAFALGKVPLVGGLMLVVSLAIIVLVGIGYFPYTYARYRASPGKAIMGLRLADRETGQTLPRDRAVLRGCIQTFLLWPLFGLIYWWKYFDAKGQTLHDRLTDAAVVHVGAGEICSPIEQMREDVKRMLGKSPKL